MLPSITPQNDFLHPGSSTPELSFPEGAASSLPAWDRVNFQDLTHFEMVVDQYQDRGLTFEGAIALIPSNPSFMSATGTVVLMPAAGRKMIKVYLQQPICHITIGVRGAGIVNCVALDVNGHCITRCSTDGPKANPTDHKAPTLFPQQEFNLTAQQLAVLILESDTPFIIENIFFTA